MTAAGDDTSPIRAGGEVALPPDAAFDRFVRHLGRWWPIGYTWSEARFGDAAVEPRAGGRWYETSLDGEERSWGGVRAYEPGTRLVLGFNVSPRRQPEPPERESEVEIRFAATGGGTRVELEHRDLARHGEEAGLLRQGMDSPQGWPLILASFARDVRLVG